MSASASAERGLIVHLASTGCLHARAQPCFSAWPPQAAKAEDLREDAVRHRRHDSDRRAVRVQGWADVEDVQDRRERDVNRGLREVAAGTESIGRVAPIRE